MASLQGFLKVPPEGFERNGWREIFPGGTFQKLCSDVIFVVCSHTFTLFWLRKMSVTIKIFRISFCVFVYAFPLEISSIFGKIFPFPFSYFVQLLKVIYMNLTLHSQTRNGTTLTEIQQHLSCSNDGQTHAMKYRNINSVSQWWFTKCITFYPNKNLKSSSGRMSR